MNIDGIFVPTNVFLSLSEDVRNTLINALKGDVLSGQNEDDGLAEFSPAQAKKFLDGCSEKTKNVVREMVKGNTRHFHIEDLGFAESLSGVWAGITKRTRTVLDDADAYLIDWGGQQEEKDYNAGSLSEMTYKSLRKAFGIK